MKKMGPCKEALSDMTIKFQKHNFLFIITFLYSKNVLNILKDMRKTFF